ncbi:MAG: hypothetical protein WD810_03160 [Solirubrobacterales bacterium]
MPSIRGTSHSVDGLRWLLPAVALALLIPALLASAAQADLQIGSVGGGNGQYQDPRAVAVDSVTGEVFIADRGNRRVNAFSAAGTFLRSFGWGVAASGPSNNPKNQIEELEVDATGGAFQLRFIQISHSTVGPIMQTTGPIAFDAPATGSQSVQSALEELVAMQPGDVSVTGPAGGPWTIEFTGSLADARIHALEGLSAELTGGAESVTVTTLQVGANFEVCEASAGDVCRPGQYGPEARQLNPTGVAVDSTSHEVYVFDGLESSSTNESDNNRVQKFTAAGTFLYMLGGEVDKGPSHPGNICTAAYLAEGENCGRGVRGSSPGFFNRNRSGVALGPGGALYVTDGPRVQKFEPSGTPAGEVALPGGGPEPDSEIAVDSSGNIYVPGTNTVLKFDPSGTQIGSFSSITTGGLAVGESDTVLVADENSGADGLSRYSASGTLEQVSYTERGNAFGVRSLAPYSDASGDVFAVENDYVSHVPFPPPGPVALPNSATASGIGNVKALLHMKLNSEGKATTFHYQYVDQKGFEEGGFSGPAVKTTSEGASIGADFVLHDADQEVTGLTPGTLYHFRAVAKNADGEGRLGPEATFETAPPMIFGPAWSTGVGTDAATLHAELNPVGFAATGYFEYVDDATFKASGFATAEKAPTGVPLDFGAGEALVERSVLVYPLSAATTYHYRLVASDHCKPVEPTVVCIFEGPERTLTTFAPSEAPTTPCPNAGFREGPGAFLADCRAYEMVSPVDKGGSNIEVAFNITGLPARLDQSTADGRSITYSAYKAFAEPEGAPYSSQYVSIRGTEGWSTESISPPREGPTLYNSAGLDYQFKAFTPDLCFGWPLQDTALSLAAGSVPGYPNLYRRDNCEPGRGAFQTITTVKPPNLAPKDFFPELQGFSADASKAFFVTRDKLTENAKKGFSQVYEASGGVLKLVCVLPNGKVANEGCSVGTPFGAGTGSALGGERRSQLTHAISEDGSRVFWTQAESGPGKLYVRIDGAETVGVSEKVSPEGARFWGAAADGSVVLFTIGSTLYEFDVETKTTPTLIAEGVYGVAGASEDASRIYFISTKALTGEAAAGKPNLFLAEGGGFDFVATLPAADASESGLSPAALFPSARISRVTPDGNRIAFMSTGSLTGYDNADADSGEADAEVFLYDATVDNLICASCNPSGVRPTGRKVKFDQANTIRAAAWIPAGENQLYAPRVMSDDGSRLYFNGFEALVARDTNGRADVYEWEAPGAGDCSEASPTFSPTAGGCVSLISSGDSPEDSELVDLSASGDDVFFKTASSLVSQDPGLIDVYDARGGGGAPPPPPPPAECEGEACQNPAPAPEDPTPASATVISPPDPTPPKPCPKGKHKVKKNGKARCVKNKGKKAKGKQGRHNRGTSR